LQNYKFRLNAVNIHTLLAVDEPILPAFKFSGNNPNMATHIPRKPKETPSSFPARGAPGTLVISSY
jgi:hypothetical protein